MKNITTKKMAVIVMVALATLLAPLVPIQSAMAQSRQGQQGKRVIRKQAGRALSAQERTDLREGRALYHTDARPGTRAYYEDDDVRYSATEAVVHHGDFLGMPGGDPQIDVSKGESRPSLLDDEEMVPNDIEGRNIMTMSRHNILHLYKLPKFHKDGSPIMIVRNKFTKKMYYIFDCVNWSRDDLQIVDNTPKCVDVPTERKVSRQNAKGETEYGTEYDYVCRKETVWETVTAGNCPCVPGETFKPLLQEGFGNENPYASSVTSVRDLKNAPPFKVSEMIRQKLTVSLGAEKVERLLAAMEAKYPGISELVLLGLYLEMDLCINAAGLNEVHFLGITADEGRQPDIVKKSRWWKKVLKIILFVAIGVAAFFIIRSLTHGSDLIKKTPVPPRVPPAGRQQ